MRRIIATRIRLCLPEIAAEGDVKMSKIATTRSGAASANQVKLLVMTGLLAALGCVATMVIVVPTPTGGYVNLGDTVVLLGAWLLGPVYGAIAGGIGPALADLFAGYGVYVPATLAIKAAMGMTAAVLYRALGRRHWALPVCGIAAEGIMVAGYCAYDTILTGSLAVGLTGVPGNLVQGAFGVAASVLLTMTLKKSAYVRRAFPEL